MEKKTDPENKPKTETPDNPPDEKDAPVLSSAPAAPVTADELTEAIAKGFPEPTDSPAGNADGKTPIPGPDRSGGGQPGTPPVVSSGRYGETDARGVVFDPVKHAATPDGKPKRNKNGYFYSNQTGKSKPKKNKADLSGNAPPAGSSGSSGSSSGPGSIPAFVPPIDRYAISAEGYCQTGYAVATVLFDDSGWQPDSPAEHETMKTAVADTLRHWDIGELSPPQRLAITVLAYGGKRSQRPNTKERMILYWIKFRSWVGWKKKAVDEEMAEDEKSRDNTVEFTGSKKSDRKEPDLS